MSIVYHQTVLLNECLEGLNISSSGTYVDVTFGGGGHSRAILEKLDSGRLIAFDRDNDAHSNKIENDNFLLLQQNFKYLKNNLRLHKAIPVDGLLADLGVSSHQFDAAERGFSTRYDADLDMRMDQNSELTAKEVVNEYDDKALFDVFKNYGVLKNAWKITLKIIAARKMARIERTEDLKKLLEPLAGLKKKAQFFAQVFQALRIEVNQEMDALKRLLEQSVEVLRQGGRLVVISYHSLEDRLVKNFIKAGRFDGQVEKDFYGKPLRPLKAITNKVIVPTQEEIMLNSRARSAKLRIAEKL